jgi:hypothetical protein
MTSRATSLIFYDLRQRQQPDDDRAGAFGGHKQSGIGRELGSRTRSS